MAGGSSDSLSHILFEKDHQIATLQSSLDQSEQEKMSLSEQVTDYKRFVFLTALFSLDMSLQYLNYNYMVHRL